MGSNIIHSLQSFSVFFCLHCLFGGVLFLNESREKILLMDRDSSESILYVFKSLFSRQVITHDYIGCSSQIREH
jgi:hypothetical protein